jgi:hypothetical protein
MGLKKTLRGHHEQFRAHKPGENEQIQGKKPSAKTTRRKNTNSRVYRRYIDLVCRVAQVFIAPAKKP